jgi:hypothetical protein
VFQVVLLPCIFQNYFIVGEVVHEKERIEADSGAVLRQDLTRLAVLSGRPMMGWHLSIMEVG